MDLYLKEFAFGQRHIGVLFVTIGLCSGCTSQQLYMTAQAYQRNQCLYRPEQGDRDQCLGNSNQSYDEYNRKASGLQRKNEAISCE